MLGVSHFYGEAKDFDGQTKFWRERGYRLDFELDLPVSDEKQRFLLSDPADAVKLRYLKSETNDGAPGLEFLVHAPATTRCADLPLLSLFLRASKSSAAVDPLGDRVVEDPRLTASTTAVIRTRLLGRSEEFLRLLGFVPCALSAEEAPVLGLNGGTHSAWLLKHALFAQLALRAVLVEDPSVEAAPKVDRPGLSGISLVAPSLDELDKVLPLKARQTFEGPGRTKEVAFHNEAGLLVEFISSMRRPR